MKTIKVFLLIIFSLLTIALITGCSNDSSKDAHLISATHLETLSQKAVDQKITNATPEFTGLSIAIGGDGGHLPITVGEGRFENIIEILRHFFKNYLYHDIDIYKLVYDNIDYKGMTGLLVVPQGGTKDSFPMIALQHPTQVLRKMSPSNYGQITIDDQLTIPLALFLGRAGYIVVVADYPGLGDNRDIHPYCTKRLGPVVTSMMNATLEMLRNKGEGQTFNGDVYLMGFSEGGYATTVTAQDIEQRYSSQYKLKATAALDGPHSLSETMRNVMLTADKNFSAPYFLPYVINGFADAYGSSLEIIRFENAIVNPTIVNPQTQKQEPFNPNLRARLYGDYSGKEINDYIRLVQPYVGPKTILTRDFIVSLSDRNSKVYEVLKKNDSTTGWSPKTKLTFFHNVFDDLVPYNNSERAYNDLEIG